MHKKLSLISLMMFLCATSFAQPTVRIKDLARIATVRDNQLVGYGLVVGLEGTGDDEKTIFTPRSMANMLLELEITVDMEEMEFENVAAVMVTASLPPFARVGDRIDVLVSSIGDAESLEGGVLLQTPLRAANGEIYAVAQGPISIGGLNVHIDEGLRNHSTTGMIPGGALVEREVTFDLLEEGYLPLVLKDADFTNVSKIAKAINDKFAAEIALPEDGSLVKVKVPPEYEGKLVEFIADIEEIEIEPDVPLRVVVNERTGTVVMGGEIKVREVAVTHGNLSVVVREKVEEIEEVPEGRERIERTMIIPEAPNVNDVVRALNAIGATPRDIIAILQAIKAAGALHAELIIM